LVCKWSQKISNLKTLLQVLTTFCRKLANITSGSSSINDIAVFIRYGYFSLILFYNKTENVTGSEVDRIEKCINKHPNTTEFIPDEC